MLSKFRIALGMTLIFAIAFAIPVFAGGWAIITLDEIPTGLVAGEPVTVGFTVLQHGQTPMNDLEPTIILLLPKEEQILVSAQPDGKPGHYTAIFSLPKEGEWEWSIQAFTMEQQMPVLHVAAAGIDVTSQPFVKSELVSKPVSLFTVVRLSALGVGLLALVLAFWRKSRLVALLAVGCLLIGISSFVVAPVIPEVEAQGMSSSDAVSEDRSMSQMELGGQLFVAKGCIICHANSKLKEASTFDMVGGAPDLTNFSASPEYLRMRLADPASVKADTWMPDLDLSESEIEALIAFINSK